MTTPILYIKDGNLSFADKIILGEIEFYLYPGDKICLVGKNGCGKSSLMKVMMGEYELDGGALFKDTSSTVGYLKQDNVKTNAKTVLEYVMEGLVNEEYKYKADIILKNLEIDGSAELKTLSGGQLRRASLGKSLIQSPDVLLLDEPTNHLDIKAIVWLESFIKEYKGAVICISHDRTFLTNVTNKIWWLDRSVLRKSNQGFKYFDTWQEEVIAYEEAQLKKLDKKLAEENLWLQQGVTARRKRNQGRLANLRSLRQEHQAHKTSVKTAKAKLQVELAESSSKSRFIIEAEHISFSYENKKILEDFTIRIKKGEKIGLIGPNGSGKSTLIKLLVGELQPENGKIRAGNNLEITYFDQHRLVLNIEESIIKTICPNGGDRVFLQNRDMHVASYLKQFLFDPKILHAKVSTLSGGERNRLLLAKTLIDPGNFLILDEPTNDLDMDTLELLLEILSEYTGTLLVVSHDRDFLDRLVTRTLVFTPEKEVIDFIGGYEDYQKFYQKEPEVKPVQKASEKVERQKPSTPSLSYKYIHLQKTLPIEIEKLEKEIADLEIKMSDPNFYSREPVLFAKLSKSLEEKTLLLEQKMTEWIEVEEIVQQGVAR